MADTSAVATSLIEGLDVPAEVRAAIKNLCIDLIEAAAANLAGLALYGGLARGRYRPGKSDINLVVLLEDTSAESLARIAPALRAAWRAFRIDPFIINPSEISRLGETFPTKLLDIQDHHIMLVGEDPFSRVEVSREQIRLRVEQSLTNIALRLRRRYVSIFDDPRSIAASLAETAVSLKVELGAMMRLAGRAEPLESTSAAVLKSAAEAFDLDREALARIAALRQDENLPQSLQALYDRVLATVTRAADIVSKME